MRKLFLLLALIVAGAQSAWAVDPAFWVNDVGYWYNVLTGEAFVVSYRGSAETLIIPDTVSNGSNKYPVKKIKKSYNDDPVYIPTVKTIIFEGKIYLVNDTDIPTFNCPALTDIVFKGGTPALEDSFSNYFGTREGKYITAHVADKTAEEIAEMKTSAAVWCDFADILPLTDTYTQNIVCVGGKGTVKVHYTTSGTTTTKDIAANDLSAFFLNEFAQGDLLRFEFNGYTGETMLLTRNGTPLSPKKLTTGQPLYIDFNTSNNWGNATFIISITEDGNINFADSNVKSICVANWDTNGDGELSYAEAAAVTTLVIGSTNKSAFYNNKTITSFDELQYFTGLTTLDENAFYLSNKLTSVTLPKTITSIGKSAFSYCELLETIYLHEGITSIGPSAFFSCKKIKAIALPQSLTTIGNSAFSDGGLRGIYIPAGVTSIGNQLFNGCRDMTSIVIDEANTVYDSRNSCNAIIKTETNTLQEGCRTTVIPETVTAIGNSAFRKRGIPSLVIPESVSSIGTYAFMWVNQSYGHPTYYLQRLEMKGTTPITVQQNRFGTENIDYPKQCTLVVPAGKKQAYIDAGWSETYFKEIVEAAADVSDASPTWSIHNETEGDVIVEQTLKNGTTETTTYAGNLNDLVIDDTQVSKVTLKVYAENANEAKPVRVLVNGQDVSYQFSTMPNDGDGFRLCYEVPVSELTNCSWDISYNTDHAQTFVVKGGSRESLVEVEREILYGGPNLCIFRNDGPATIYLPPFNSEYNSNIDMTVYANAGEGVTIKRNGVDVTALFEEKAESGYKYYDLDINDADFEGDNTVSQFGFDIRDAAVWEIVYKSVEEQMKTLRVSNLDQMEIVYERNYTDGTTISEYFKNSETGEIAKYVERIFDDSDRENTRFIYLHVPIPESLPIRVLCNGEDVTYSKHDEWINRDWVTYIASMTQDQTWDISYDTSHKQTFIVKGGLYPEVNYEYKADDVFKGVQVGGITEVFLPDYNPDYDNTYADFTIGTLPNESFTALRNGVDVTDKFTKELRDNMWVYRFNFDNAEVAAALGVDLRDPAVWQITIGDTGRYDLNNDNKVDISDVTKLVNEVLNK